MAHPSPYPLCIFCDERANSREHAIPKWVGKRFGMSVAHKFAGDQSLVTPEKRTIGAYHAMVMFAGLALKVFGVYEPVPRHRLHFDTESLKQVSPRIERSISWPLFPPAGDSNVKYMAELPPLTPDD